jgi:hypothetical protein
VDVETTRDRLVQHIEKYAATVGHEKARPDEGDRDPHAVSGRPDSFTDAPERRLTVDQRANAITQPCRV